MKAADVPPHWVVTFKWVNAPALAWTGGHDGKPGYMKTNSVSLDGKDPQQRLPFARQGGWKR